MTNYMSFLLQPFMDLFEIFTASKLKNQTLWLALIGTLTKTLQHDEGGEVFIRLDC